MSSVAVTGISLIAILVPFVFALMVLAIICWMIVKLAKGGRKTQHMHEDEAQLMQEIFNGLARMERRVETLETLLLDKERDAR